MLDISRYLCAHGFVTWFLFVLGQVELFIIVTGVIGIALSAAVREKKSLTRKLHLMNVELENQVEVRTLELREANDELRISQKNAEQASSAKSDFLANMSHEIRWIIMITIFFCFYFTSSRVV